MDSERRGALESAIGSMRAGRMTRRTFLARALALGLSASATLGLLEACSRRDTVFLVWESEHDASSTYGPLVDAFNQSNGAGIHITYRTGPSNSGQLHGEQQTMLGAQSGSTDILSMDITWTAEYAANDWLLPLDARWSAAARAPYLQAAQDADWLSGHLWAAPYRVDAGAIYYRTDLVERPPATWSDLAASASQLRRDGKAQAGFLWPGAQTEGLVCLFSEVLTSYGGAVFASGDPYTVTLRTPEAKAALGEMIGWLGGASPLAVTTYADDAARRQWQQGSAVYMRNWLSAYPLPSDGDAANVRGKIGIAPLPSGPRGGVGHSCLGGWQIGINHYTDQADAAWEFITYLLAPERLLGAARASGMPVALTTAYDDPSILARQPALARMKLLLATAQPRPISPVYPAITTALQARLHQALLGQITPDEALSALQTHLQALSTRAIPLPPDVPTVTPATA